MYESVGAYFYVSPDSNPGRDPDPGFLYPDGLGSGFRIVFCKKNTSDDFWRDGRGPANSRLDYGNDSIQNVLGNLCTMNHDVVRLTKRYIPITTEIAAIDLCIVCTAETVHFLVDP